MFVHVKILDTAGGSKFSAGLLYMVKEAAASRYRGNFAYD